MVLISEITDEATKPGGDGGPPDPKPEQQDDGEPAAAAAAAETTALEAAPHEQEQQLPPPAQEPTPLPAQQEQQPPPQETPTDPTEIPPPPPPPPSTSSSTPPEDSQLAAPVPPPSTATVKVPYNEYALRVAYIMRSYLHMRPGGATASGPTNPATADGEDRCRAMMEVTRKENGQWGLSKVELEHTHQLDPPPDPAGTLAAGGLVPVVGMEFDSISAAKQYYGAYSEKMGFQSKTSSGKRSRGTRLLIMQRFSCSKGHFPTYSNAAENAARKRKRGPYKKRHTFFASTQSCRISASKSWTCRPPPLSSRLITSSSTAPSIAPLAARVIIIFATAPNSN